MSRDDYDKGMKTRRKVLGDEWVDRSLATLTPFNEEFQELITRYAWNEIWNRPRIPHKVRRMIVIAQMVALGRWEEFQLHVRAALASGDLDTLDLKEILLQSAVYCGVPAANHAFKEAREVMKELYGGPGAQAGKPAEKPAERPKDASARPGELRFTDSGGFGAPVVLVHAIGCDRRMWDALAEALAPGWRVIRPDVRGHGASPVTPRPYSLEMLADDVAALLDRLGIERAHWVGLSMGGMIGQAFALRYPERIGKLVIANSTSSYGPEGPGMWQARARLVEEGGVASIRDMVTARYFSEEARRSQPALVEAVMARFLQTAKQGYLGCCDAIAALDFSGDLARIKAPTLVIAGGADAGTPTAMSEAIARGIPGAKLAVIPGAAHLSAVEKPAEFNALVREFLAG